MVAPNLLTHVILGANFLNENDALLNFRKGCIVMKEGSVSRRHNFFFGDLNNGQTKNEERSSPVLLVDPLTRRKGTGSDRSAPHGTNRSCILLGTEREEERAVARPASVMNRGGEDKNEEKIPSNIEGPLRPDFSYGEETEHLEMFYLKHINELGEDNDCEDVEGTRHEERSNPSTLNYDKNEVAVNSCL
jgi:hypothetical protein